MKTSCHLAELTRQSNRCETMNTEPKEKLTGLRHMLC